MAKKDMYVVAANSHCRHCEAAHPQMEVLENGALVLYCDPNCMRARHRDRTDIPIRVEMDNMTHSLRVIRESGAHEKEYRAMWASRATLQALLDRNEVAYRMYRKRGQDLWCECLAECPTDGRAAITAQFMKLWFDLCDMCDRAFITSIPYDTIEVA